MMKRIAALLLTLAVALCAALPVFAAGTIEVTEDVSVSDAYDWTRFKGQNVTLNVYNWGEYISNGSDDSVDVVAAFEKLTGIKVNYTTFDSNESLYAKLKSGAANYDVIIPSDYMVAKMINEGMLAPLDYDNIPNFQKIDAGYRNPDYDPQNAYTVPYMLCTTGIIYNSKYVDEADVTGWELLWNEKYAGKILMFDNSRDAFGIAEYLLGYDVNTTDETELQACAAKLAEQKPVVQQYVMDQIFDAMENEEAWIAPYYAGDYLTMVEENPDLAFVQPEEGSNLFVDAMCIPTSAKNKLIAERYIDFMLTEEPAVANAEYTYYGSPNRLVRENEEYIEYMNSIKDGGFDLMYDTDNVQATAYENLTPEKLALLNQLWEELKSDIDISTGIYVICGVIIAVMAGFGVCFAVRRKIRNIY